MSSTGRHACVTLLSDDSYLPGSIALGESLRGQGWPHEKFVLVTTEVSREAREALLPWWDEIVIIDPIVPPDWKALWEERFARVYTKLRVWQLVRFDKLLYIDSDAIVLGSLSEALERPRFAAAPCITPPDTFNAGVLVLEPDEAVFQDMRSRLFESPDYGLADQGFLNSYFSDWYHGPAAHRLPSTFNVNRALYLVPPAWDRLREDWRVLHFLGPRKPWALRWGWPIRAIQAVMDRAGWRGEGPSPSALWWRTWDDALRHAPEAAAVAKLGKGRGWNA